MPIAEARRAICFSEECEKVFNLLKHALIPNSTKPFELMCDSSEFVLGVVLSQRHNKVFHTIYYASRTLIEAQIKYTTTEKELLVVVFAFDKFRSYAPR